jgi:hypothetical protein
MVGPSKVLVQEKTPSPIAQNKGGIKANMDSLVKKPFMTPKKKKGKEKVSKLNKEPPTHVHLHFSKESNRRRFFIGLPKSTHKG